MGSRRERLLRLKMRQLGVCEQDIIEHFIRARAPGGSNVQKTSTCVYLKHISTGIEVKSQEERSQAQNRIRAREILLEKIDAQVQARLSREKLQRYQNARQKRKRPKAVQLRILAGKKKHAEKKLLRAKIHQISLE